MSKVKAYLDKLKREAGPVMYVIRSDRESVKFFEVLIVSSGPGNKLIYPKKLESVRYKLDAQPYECEIYETEKYGENHGYASGIGDLWYWSYFCTLDKEEAVRLFNTELKRVMDKYFLRDEITPIVPACG